MQQEVFIYRSVVFSDSDDGSGCFFIVFVCAVLAVVVATMLMLNVTVVGLCLQGLCSEKLKSHL